MCKEGLEVQGKSEKVQQFTAGDDLSVYSADQEHTPKSGPPELFTKDSVGKQWRNAAKLCLS